MDPRSHAYHPMPSETAPSSAYNMPPQQRAPALNAGGGARIMAPEDVDGALRYSPLTSVVPVSGVLNTLPLPHFTHYFPTRLEVNPEQQQRTQEYFNLMNRDANTPAETNFQRDEFRNTVHLINQIDDRQFRFTTPPYATPQSQPPIQLPVTPNTPSLGVFAQAVLTQTTSNFRYPTPLTPENPPFASDRQYFQSQANISPTRKLTVTSSNDRSDFKASLQPHHSPPKKQQFAVEISVRPMQPTPASSVASSSYKRQKISHDKNEGRSASPTPTRRVMERDRVDGLVSQFMSFLEDIFEAEDAFNPNAENPTEGSVLFFSSDSLREEKPWLSRETHRKLDTHMRKLGKTIAAREGLRIDTGDLARITGICERAVKAAEMVDLKEIDGEEDAEREWAVGKLQKVENAILAANVIMLLITGRGTDQQIYSEETLKSIVEVLRIFLDTLFHWISSSSSENNASDTFSVAMTCNRQISALLQSSITLLSQFESQLAETVSQENIINVLQFLAVEAIFIENQAKDKEFVITNQGIESLRVVSMGILRQVFASYPEQRSFILDEVLSSLAKLPANRQHARHFKLLDGKSIQLVSALMMRLVQACGACFSVRDVDLTSLSLLGGDEDGEDSKRQKRLQLFADEWTSASRAAHQSATYIVSYLTSRALQTSKTAPTDSPFKALLDIFIEDFLTVLTAAEWPAAELLLRCLVKNLYVCIDSDSHGAQVKNVALEAVGQIAAKIRAIRKKLTTQLKSRTDESTDESNLCARIFEYTTGPSLTLEELKDIQEAYSLIWARSDGGMRDALRFQVCGWALFVLSTDKVDEEEQVARRSTPLIEELAKIARAGKSQYDSLSLPSDLEVSLACTTLLSRSPLFQSYDTMLSRILRSMSEKQPTFRTKALRTLGQIILADPDILSLSNVRHQVALRISDPSPAVREAAIELVAKHIASDPVLGKEYYEVMRARINDTGLGVRKRVIKLLKDIYSKSDDRSMQAQIADSILSRITDEEHSELAVKTMEELWFMPAGEEIDMHGTFDFVRLSIKAQKTIRARTMAMVRVIGENEDRKVALFRRLLRTMCSETGKPGKALQTRLDACKLSVHCLYEIALNDAAEAKMANFKRCLLVISLFARSTPSVFSVDQITNLEPYLKGASDKDDQEIAYLVVVIYRTLLALTQLTFQSEFLARTMTTIATSMSSVSLKHLKESVPAVCLIAGMLNDYSNIIKVVQTCFRLVSSSQKAIDTGGLNAGNPTLIRCLYLLGLFAQHAKIDAQAELFRSALGLAKNVLVTVAIARALAAFTKPVVPEALRKIAITSYGFLCLGNTEFFKSETSDAQQIIISALRGSSVTLKRTILEIFQEYFAIEEHKAELLEGKDKEDVDLSTDIGVLTGTAKTVNTDEASFFLAGNYLGDIMACALSDSMPLAIAGTEVLESIVRGGLAAPNDWFPALVALETSPVTRVRQISSRSRVWAIVRYEHVIEGAYSHAMQKMFDYRKVVLNSVKGYQLENEEPLSFMGPLYSDIKTKKRFRLRFLKSLVNLLDRDSQSREAAAPVDIDFARFIVENLMYLEYGAIEEVHTVIHTVDRIMSSTGISLLQSFESGDKSESMTVLAHRSVVLSLLIGLKQNLKFSYNLTEAKCRAFDPKKAGGVKDNKAAVRAKGFWIFEWDDIPYLVRAPQGLEQMQEQLQAFAALMHRHDVVGSQEVNSTSDDEAQNASTKDDDDSVTVITTGEDEDMSQGGPSTPVKKVKKRKEGSENGSVKKKQKKLESIVVQKW